MAVQRSEKQRGISYRGEACCAGGATRARSCTRAGGTCSGTTRRPRSCCRSATPGSSTPGAPTPASSTAVRCFSTTFLNTPSLLIRVESANISHLKEEADTPSLLTGLKLVTSSQIRRSAGTVLGYIYWHPVKGQHPRGNVRPSCPEEEHHDALPWVVNPSRAPASSTKSQIYVPSGGLGCAQGTRYGHSFCMRTGASTWMWTWSALTPRTR